MLAAKPAEPSVATWEAVLDRSIPAVVAIRTSSPRSFDTDASGNSVATGFVVDAERGIILTNRHVVEPGPVVAEAVFYNHEEVPLRAIYRDPVHDFGLYRFDPADLKFMKPVALTLEPDHAKVGIELRVVGNDAGEKISILDGTLARLDREAPNYGGNRYNDFDTFYFQAASSTSGGSSGSPVLDAHGHVVALNAGGSTRSASSYYLPLHRVERALERVRAGEPVTRGTLGTVLVHKPYDEVRRLGVRPETEAAVRAAFPAGNGMLVFGEVNPGGPAYGKLEPGDVLVRVGGELVTTFVPWEAVLDDAVGRPVTLEVERGGQPLTVEVTVHDLHAITPDRFLEFSGGVLHALSWQQARNHAVPVDSGVYVATPGYALSEAGIPDGAVITAIGEHPVRTLDDLVGRLAALPDRTRVPVRYFSFEERHRARVAVVTVDRRWFPMQTCRRDDETGLWPCVAAPEPPPAPPPTPATATFPETPKGPGRDLAPSLVWLDVSIPYRVEGVPSAKYTGTGVVVDAERGLVVTDRNTAPILLADVTLTFAGAVEIPARVLWLDPLHNVAILRYDPARVAGLPVRSAVLADEPLEAGDKVWHVGLTAQHQVATQQAAVRRVASLVLPVSSPPQFRDSGVDLVEIGESGPASGGVLADKQGRVVALWASFVNPSGDRPTEFFRGLPTAHVLDSLEPVRAGARPTLRSLGAELAVIDLADARNLGLSDAWAAKLAADAPERPQVVVVVRTAAGTAARERLREADLVVAVDGEPVTTFREVELGARTDTARLIVIRDGKELALEVPTVDFGERSVDRVVQWAGAVLHAPHVAAQIQRAIPPEGVYVAWTWNGSPASRYGVRPTWRIVEIDGVPVRDLDGLLAAVAARPDRSPVRLRVVDLDGKPQVITLKLDLHYWPTLVLRHGEDGWSRR